MTDTVTLTIGGLLRDTREGAQVTGELRAQVESVSAKSTREGKPYAQIALVDAGGQWALRVWSDHAQYRECTAIEPGTFVGVRGSFLSGVFGLEAERGWRIRKLTTEERVELLEGTQEERAVRERDYRHVMGEVDRIADPRLSALCRLFLREHGERFVRAPAARAYHHSRRGGLVEHTAQMMRAARAMLEVYPELNADLLLSGVLFHDSGKLWENGYREDGFAMERDERGEMLGHITIGIELVNALWRRLLQGSEAEGWRSLQPASEDVRLHLLHLICSHHGEPEFGSPVVPKTPEAFALHHLDNLDAKLEMVRAAYQTGERIGGRIVERVRPLPGNLMEPLARFEADGSMAQ